MAKIAKALGDESYAWLVEAMQPLEASHTNQAFEEGDRVKAQLQENLGLEFSVEFEYQGSVTNDTHVRFHSDIDLLAIHGVYTTYYSGYQVENPVSNEVVVDALMSLRNEATRILKRKFPAVDIDESGSKAVALSGGSLKRDIDVVLCNWWNTKHYMDYKVRANRGIQVLDAPSGRVGNQPFLHNWHIHDKDGKVQGCLRKAARLLKTLKYDKKPAEAKISSYDIVSLVFRMPDTELTVAPGEYLKLAKNTSGYLHRLIDDTALRESLFVPNGTRRIFCDEGASLMTLREITVELDSLLAEISAQQTRMIMLAESTQNFEKKAAWNEVRASRVQQMENRLTQMDL